MVRGGTQGLINSKYTQVWWYTPAIKSLEDRARRNGSSRSSSSHSRLGRLPRVQPRLPSETVSSQLNRSHLAARDAEVGLPLEHRRLKTAVETQQDLISEKKKKRFCLEYLYDFSLVTSPSKSAAWKHWSEMVVLTALKEQEDPKFKVTLGSRGRPSM